MARLDLSFLGTFRVTLDQHPLTSFRSANNQGLLAYLALHSDRPVSREVLAALLWPDESADDAHNNLRQAIFRLRQLLGDGEDGGAPFLTVTRQTAQFNSDSDHSLDVGQFLRAIEAHDLDAAAAAYSGELLHGFTCDSLEYESWLRLERENLHQLALEAMFEAARDHLAAGRLDKAQAAARRQLVLEPWREPAHRQMMQAYALAGDRAAAVAQFETCRRTLRTELGIEPSQETIALLDEIKSGRFGRMATDETIRPPARMRHNLPADATPLIGREIELAAIGRLLAGERQRLVTIVGPGGMGKTRLALAVGLSLLSQFEDGVYFVDLAPVEQPEEIAPAIAAALEYKPPDPALELKSQLFGFLGRRNLLLILDNFEQIPNGAAVAGEILRSCPSVALLITSRERLNLTSESRYELGGLEYPATLSAVDAMDYTAVRLFVDSGRRARPGFDLTASNVADVVRVCRLVRGMPLGLILASGWLEILKSAEIAAEIESGLEFLSADMADLPERQRSMRAVFDYVWQTLLPPERAALAMLSVLRGPFGLDAAEAIAGASSEVIALLLDQSLLRSSGGGQFEMHELLRQYAAAKLAADPSREATARERHADHYLALLATRGGLLGGPQSKEALAALGRNMDNVRVAWGWVVDVGRLEAIERVAAPLEAFYRFSGLSAEGAETLSAASARLEALIERGVAAAAARPIIYDLYRREALLLELHGAGEAALARLEKARAGWQALGDRGGMVRVLGEIGYVKMRHFWVADTREELETTLALARELGDDMLIATALHNLGNALSWATESARGRALLEESLDHYRAAGETRWLAGTLNDIGMTYAFGQDIENARAFFRQSLSISEELGDQPGIAMAAANLGAIALDFGDPVESEAFSRRGQATAQDIGDKLMLAISVGNLGHAALMRGEREAAMRLYRDTVALTRESGYTFMLIEAVLGLASLAAGSDPVAAARWLAAVAAWRVATGFGVETPFIRALRESAEARLRDPGDEPPLLIETAAAEATAWTVEQGW